MLFLHAAVATAAPLKVADLTDNAALLPLSDALHDLAGRVEVTTSLPTADALKSFDVLILGAATDVTALGVSPGDVAAFVRGGGGVLIAGLPGSLPKTHGLMAFLGEAAPADVPCADLFPSDDGSWMWIPPQEGETPDHLRYIRKSIRIAKPVKRAYIRCTVDNLYWVFLNGEEVGYHWSWFDYELWDITGKLQAGENVVAFKGRNVDGPGGFFAQIGVEYEDGTRELIASDASWKFLTREVPGWNRVGHDDSAWGKATQIVPMWKRRALPDATKARKGRLSFDRPHPVLNAIADRFGDEHAARGVVPRDGGQTLIRLDDLPIVVARPLGEGRVLLIDTLRPVGVAQGDMTDDLIAASILWLGGRAPVVKVAEARYPAPVLTLGAEASLDFGLRMPSASVPCVLEATIRRGDEQVGGGWRLGLPSAENTFAGSVALRGHDTEGAYEFQITAIDKRGELVFRRDTVTVVRNPVNLALSIVSNRYTVAEGVDVQFRGAVEGSLPPNAVVAAKIVDPWGRDVASLASRRETGAFLWRYPVPNLAVGTYELVTRIASHTGETVDESRLPFHVVPRLDLRGFYPTTMRLSRFTTTNRAAIEREIDDIIAHGFNTLTFSGRRLGADPGSPYDYAEDYAQRRGMAISYSFQGTFSLLNRNAPPSVSVFSPEYAEAIRPGIEQAVATCKLVPRLLNVQGYMDEPFQISGKTLDTSSHAHAEFRRRYGVDMPSREEAVKDPELWLKLVDFWSDGFAAGWRQSYALIKELYPDFWVELTHDSHNTFGAAGGAFRGSWAIDDVFHWGAPFDSVNYDIYPYLSTDYRRGKFRQTPLPRIAGVHMAFAQMRNLAYTYDKKLGFWLESGWATKLAPTSPLRQYVWSPRELTFTAIAAGCDYLNTFWGIPEDKRWWEAYRGVMGEVGSIAPLLSQTRVPRAKAAFLFPRTQHVLLQEEYWNVMVALEAFRQAPQFGDLRVFLDERVQNGFFFAGGFEGNLEFVWN